MLENSSGVTFRLAASRGFTWFRESTNFVTAAKSLLILNEYIDEAKPEPYEKRATLVSVS